MSDEKMRDKHDLRNRVDSMTERNRLIDACESIISLIEDDGDIGEVGGEPLDAVKEELKSALHDFKFGATT